MRSWVAPIVAAGVVAAGVGSPPAAREGPRLPRRVTRVVRLHTYEPGGPPALDALVMQCDVILVGTAAAVVREEPIPANATDPSCWYGTTYLVEVERYLMWEGAPNQPPTIKVAMLGGADSDNASDRRRVITFNMYQLDGEYNRSANQWNFFPRLQDRHMVQTCVNHEVGHALFFGHIIDPTNKAPETWKALMFADARNYFVWRTVLPQNPHEIGPMSVPRYYGCQG